MAVVFAMHDLLGDVQVTACLLGRASRKRALLHWLVFSGSVRSQTAGWQVYYDAISFPCAAMPRDSSDSASGSMWRSGSRGVRALQWCLTPINLSVSRSSLSISNHALMVMVPLPQELHFNG